MIKEINRKDFVRATLGAAAVSTIAGRAFAAGEVTTPSIEYSTTWHFSPAPRTSYIQPI